MLPFHAFSSHVARRTPKSCPCGNTVGHECSEVGLCNHRDFPPFAYLPDENDIDPDYYRENGSSYRYSPSRHWALVGEIIENRSDFIRPRALLETQYGEPVLVNFHLEDRPSPAFFEWQDIQCGHTMCILYAKSRTFMDMNRGVRVEHSSVAIVFPTPLQDLASECKLISQVGKPSEKRCFGCNRARGEQDFVEPSKQCSRCKICCYCSRECQVSHWKRSHKKLCKHFNTLFKLVKADFSNFEGFFDWNFAVERSTAEEREIRERETMRNFLRTLGVEPLSKTDRLKELLQSCSEKVLKSDPIGARIVSSQVGDGIFSESFEARAEESGPLAEHPIFQAFVDLSNKYSEIKGSCYHTVDVKSNGAMEDKINDVALSILFFALPQWQLENGITGISWAFETHHYFDRNEELFSGWEYLHRDMDGFSVRSKVLTGRCDHVFGHDDMPLVAGVAASLAEKFPDQLIVRVLRSTGLSHHCERIREIAAKSTPDNVVTLWIREDMVSLGTSFRPRNDSHDLPTHLTDASLMSLTERISRARLGGESPQRRPEN